MKQQNVKIFHTGLAVLRLLKNVLFSDLLHVS